MAVVTDQTRNVIWQDLWDAERYVRYYGALADSYRIRHRNMRFALLAALLIEATVFLPNISEPLFTFLTVAGGIAIAGLAAWDAISDYAKNSALLAVASEDCASVNTQWGELWLDIESYAIDESQARARRRELLDRLNAIASRVDVGLDEKLNESCSEDATKTLVEKYA